MHSLVMFYFSGFYILGINGTKENKRMAEYPSGKPEESAFAAYKCVRRAFRSIIGM